MEANLCASLGIPSPNSQNHHNPAIQTDFTGLFTQFSSLVLIGNPEKQTKKHIKSTLPFASNSLSSQNFAPKSPRLQSASRNSPKVQSLMQNLSVFERAFIGAGGGGIAGAFTYVCLHPLDTIKTKLQTKGASQIYKNTLDAVVKTFQEKGILGFYSGVSAVIYPTVLIPPTAGAMGNIVSSAIMVPKELITQQMQAGAKGRSWEVLLRILEKDGIWGLYAGYSATLLRNLPAGVLSYSSFEYLKAAVLSKNKKSSLLPIESVCCGALAGAISASITTPLDVVKTRLMTQMNKDVVDKAAAVMYSGVSATVKQILKEEGWVGFSRGMGPRVVHSACFSALGYFAFETARLTILHRYLRHKELHELDVAPT
ncbi:PROTEIN MITOFERRINLIKE 1 CHLOROPLASTIC [Salix koriyanagi]|uniref:PROTEIN MITOFERRINLIKE 1 CHLOROPLASTIC n=1 Tax=Salix koriyanagi TaxID=2511006 RepID=A0A9Q0P4S0_9ROSI|nr:PROTEIN MITOFERRINLIKE 1 CHLOROPLASTIC [Salix koriyanagi]